MNLARILSDELLAQVERPSRYLGSELNSVHKPGAAVRLALAFPDLYDLGLGNLGLHILYGVLNRLPDVAAERVYAPAGDMEAALRQRGLKLFAVESKDELCDFDGIGFTLQSELTFTNIVNMIDLAGLPLRTADRRPSDPLTFAGGPAVFNPEPLAPFMDFFVIGDGEDVVVEIADVFRRVQGREARLAALAEVEGVYVPALYPMDVLPDGQVLPALDAPRIRKRTARALRADQFPVDYIVPFTEQVHDRVSLEVLRGCTQGCRFCQAGMTTRPVRERSIDDVEALMRRTLAATGYDEVSLVSLSTCDHSQVRGLVARTAQVAAEQKVTVSLPSLRLDSFSVDLADMASTTRRTGLTFAPEAASPRLRAVINKWIPDEELIEMATAAFDKGWEHVKTYFMIGLPTERDEDIDAIVDLCQRTVRAGRRKKAGVMVHTGVSTFVPKPFTPFQWAAQIDIGETERRQRILYEQFRNVKGVKFGRHHPEETFLEGLVSRSDRRAADLIEAAWREGARFDAWGEHLNFPAWQRAIAKTGFDTAFALRAREVGERLPWDHLDIHIPKSWFADDWERALRLQHAPDCRQKKCHKCGVIDVERELCAHMLRSSIDGRKIEKDWVRPTIAAPKEPESVQRVRFRIGRLGDARFLGHLEFQNVWMRALRRVALPVSYSQGFHPHPRVDFSSALPSGEESLAEFLDVRLSARVDVAAVTEALRRTAPAGFLVLGGQEVPMRAPALMGAVVAWDYELVGGGDAELLRSAAWSLLEAPSLLLPRKSKGGPITVDVRAMLRHLRVRDDGVVDLGLGTHAGRPGKAREWVGLLGLPATTRVVRTQVYVAEGDALATVNVEAAAPA
jgi:radical SAM family uncharacterized protein/radical SAM-linked protein